MNKDAWEAKEAGKISYSELMQRFLERDKDFQSTVQAIKSAIREWNSVRRRREDSFQPSRQKGCADGSPVRSHRASGACDGYVSGYPAAVQALSDRAFVPR